MVLQTPTNNNERSSDEILEMAVWLDMESSPAGYGEEKMKFPPGVCRLRSSKQQRKTKETEMSYKKPEIVAKSEAKQSFVAGCPEKTWAGGYTGRCHPNNAKCNLTPLK